MGEEIRKKLDEIQSVFVIGGDLKFHKISSNNKNTPRNLMLFSFPLDLLPPQTKIFFSSRPSP
jgi:hypothetical protein